MKETVTISLKKYDDLLIDRHEYLEELTRCQAKMQKIDAYIKKLKYYILDRNLDTYNLKNQDLEVLTDIDNINFGLVNKQDLKDLGISEEMMIKFIESKKQEYEEEQQCKNWVELIV